ncbi:hypothetical protein M501DRAFT_1055899 [Patellaria atrata CBS 101060]|uniref:Tcp11-domain-containing protein n=1 Tax=Patellaria atrata CBS 101060 TaxID=1346257 RepID=A0A9P4VSL4_9PEZI|nr:hypothetical protein M501DRAFT_1055899 [Patellaria atrata CBS 101060]
MHSDMPTSPDVDLNNITAINDDIPEETELMNLSDDNGQVYAPPARIAARFYRPSNTRRKSSAASSRRNSLSSTHSHTSGRSFRSGCQSNHVAQHLRRVAILETRKARLAERAAHAEQVRLRAALVKAAPRTTNSEERALAAKQAREKILAQVAAACAEEVRRAKKVAEDMKERKAAEEKRYRMEIEEKHAEAERRRLQYQKNLRRPRTSSSPSLESKKPVEIKKRSLDQDTAARRIQAIWRMQRRKHIIGRYQALDLSIDYVHEAEFEEMTALLSDQTVLDTSAKLLSLLDLLQPENNPVAESTSTRTFLSAYLILGHPQEVLSSKNGDQEQDLINKAKDLIISFESLLSTLSPSNRYVASPTQLENVSLAHAAFVSAFSDWKAQDASTLIETMVASFVNLDAIWQSVKNNTDGEVASDYKEGIRDNQVILYSKIKKLAGLERANAMIQRAIKASRRAQVRRRPVAETRPRLADALMTDTAASNPEGSITSTDGPKLPKGSSGRDADASDVLMKIFSPVPSNRVLVHELSIDKEYRIDVGPHSDIRDAFNQSVCDSMREGFRRGEDNQWTVAMAENIRAKLLRLLREGNPTYTLISEVLDPQGIQQQCVRGVFSYEKFFQFMASILPKLCAPFRDVQVKALIQELEESGDLDLMIEKLFKVLHFIDLLSLDYSNFLLMNAAPTLIREAGGYEQRMFAQDLESGTITLQKTKHWYKGAYMNVVTEASRQEPPRRPTPQRIYAYGLVDLAIATIPLQDQDVPETLDLDKARLSRIRTTTLRIATVGSILLTAKNLLKRDVRSQWKADAIRMWDALKDGYIGPDTTESIDTNPMATKLLSIIESSHPMPASSRSQLLATITRFLSQASTGRLLDPVMKVVFGRLKEHILTRVAASSSGERVRAASTAIEGLAATGLAEFVERVGGIVEELGRVSEVDRMGHGSWYEEIAREVEGMGEGRQEGHA